MSTDELNEGGKLAVLQTIAGLLENRGSAAEAFLARVEDYLAQSGRTADSLTLAELRQLVDAPSQRPSQ